MACAAVLEFRDHDKANQLGDLAEGSLLRLERVRPPQQTRGRSDADPKAKVPAPAALFPA